MRILVCRNDKLGDFMLAYPAFALLKQALPQCRITALVAPYTAPMAELCPWIDRVIHDTDSDTCASALAARLKSEKFDAAITLYSTTRIALALWRAAIPYRLAPATKLAQLFYNHRLLQHRSHSEKPEWEYNLDLIRHFLCEHGIAETPLPQPPFLHLDAPATALLREQFCAEHGIDPTDKLILVHPGSGGSAVNLSLPQYAQLIKTFSGAGRHFILSAGPGEEQQAEALARLTGDIPHSLYTSHGGLEAFTRHLACMDLYISGSTGPLHIAGALDIPTAGFYSRRRSATPLRWQTLNSPQRRLAFTPPEGADERDMASIDIIAAARRIEETFLNRI